MITTSCTTTGHFKVPEGSSLYVYKRPQPVEIKTNGEVTTKPFFWTAAGVPTESGIPYRQKKNGKPIKEGNLPTKFRVESIFWPPFALIYWPMGFNSGITYDLINGQHE